jgi:hypothetical protein
MKKRSTRKLLASAVLSAGMMLTTAAGCDGVRNQRTTTPAHTIHNVAPAETAAAASVTPAPAPMTTTISAPAAEVASFPVDEAAPADPAPAEAPAEVDTSEPAANENAAEVNTEYPACPITGNSKRPAYDQATYADCVEATQNGDATDA